MTLQQVHLRINDAATGQPTPVRLRITDADGTYYAPYGRLTEFATGVNQDVGGNVLIGAKKWAYIDGTCEILLPPGTLHIEIAKGPEYKPIDEEITLLAGKMSLRFTIERWSDVRKQGWYSGDTRAFNMMPHAALLEGQAEDLAVVNLLAQVDSIRDFSGQGILTIPNLLAFSGQQFLLDEARTGVAVNTLNWHSHLGALLLLHCHRVVYPLTFGGWFDNDHWTLDDWCDQCHRKAGLVIRTRFTDGRGEKWGEVLADVVRGKIDAFEIDFTWKRDLQDWYQLASAGFILPIVAGSGKSSNAQVLGEMRTYAQVPLDNIFSYTAWIESVRAGRTFVSNHPLVFLTVDGKSPSSEVIDVQKSDRLILRAEAASWLPFDEVAICLNSKQIAANVGAGEPPYRAVIEIEHSIDESGYFCATVQGPHSLFAHTSLQLVRVAHSPQPADPSGIKDLVNHLERMTHWAAETARCDTAHARARLVQIYDEARTILAKKLS